MNTFLLNYYLKTVFTSSCGLLFKGALQPILLNKSPTADEKAHFCFQNCCEVLSCEVHVKYIFSLYNIQYIHTVFPVLRPLFPLMVLFHCTVRFSMCDKWVAVNRIRQWLRTKIAEINANAMTYEIKRPHVLKSGLIKCWQRWKEYENIYSSKSTITLVTFYLSTSKSTSLKIYSSKSKK